MYRLATWQVGKVMVGGGTFHFFFFSFRQKFVHICHKDIIYHLNNILKPFLSLFTQKQVSTHNVIVKCSEREREREGENINKGTNLVILLSINHFYKHSKIAIENIYQNVTYDVSVQEPTNNRERISFLFFIYFIFFCNAN